MLLCKENRKQCAGHLCDPLGYPWVFMYSILMSNTQVQEPERGMMTNQELRSHWEELLGQHAR